MNAQILIFLFIILFSGQLTAQDTLPQTVESVDLQRYAGLWYEIAHIPNRFQKSCAYGTTAEYRVRKDGKMEVINQCYERDGDIDRVKGIAKIIDQNSKAKLQVSFFAIFGWHLFWGDYWILGLDDDYQWAVVGSPDRKYGWILSRAPELSSQVRKKIDDLLEKRGYNPEKFVETRHHSGNRI
ncbi:hypothetical protein GF406_09700 [candidate division KSB1 bacterium]|nr:hypothetical protein [candidate division KSB1 bacterium]